MFSRGKSDRAVCTVRTVTFLGTVTFVLCTYRRLERVFKG